MGTALSIIAVLILLGLLFMSAKRQREQKAADKEAVAQAYTGEAEAQYARSMQRREGVRAAHAERSRADASDAEVERVNPAIEE